MNREEATVEQAEREGTDSISGVRASWDEKTQQAVEATRANLRTLLATAIGIKRIEVKYDGYGDNGQIEEVRFLDQQDEQVQAPSEELESAVIDYAYVLLDAIYFC